MEECKTILAVGSIAIDTLQTPNGNRDNVLGGSATYFSMAAGLFTSVRLVGVVGEDYPDKGWKIFKSRNINIENIQVVEGKTFRWGGKYNQDYSTRNTLFTELGVFDSFSPVIHDNGRSSPLVFLGNIQPDLQLKVASLMTSAEYIVSDTMNLWIDMCPDKVDQVLKISNIFFLNHEEAFQFTGTNDIPKAACQLHALGPKIIVIKMGAEGAYLSFNDRAYYIPTFPVEKTIDPTGAGDSFAGGFMGCLAQSGNQDFLKAVLTGTAMASYCVENFGADSLLNVTLDDIDSRIAVIKERMYIMENT